MDAYIHSIAYYLPEKVVTNEELVKDFPEWNAEKVSKKTGIHQRHIAAKDETAGDMAEIAANKLFQEAHVLPEEIDFILLCTQSPDYFLPTTACILQKKLGIPITSGALDYNLGCSGYVYGLALSKGLIMAGIAKNVLLITAETYNKHIHPMDKGNRSLFGDAATATLISTKGFAKIGNFALGTDGNGAENLIVKTGAFREKEKRNELGKDEGGYINSPDYLYMNGSEIFNFTLDKVPSLLNNVLNTNSLGMENIDLYVFHQANKFMLDTIRKVCGIPKNKFFIDIENTGNTVSSTIPIAMKKAKNEAILHIGMKVMIAGFGVGYSWGGCILEC